MIEVFVIAEGRAEGTFVSELLYPRLLPMGVWARPMLTGVPSRQSHRGGHGNRYPAVRRDVYYALRQHAPRGARVTAMLDLYALPNDFPGFTTGAQTPDPYERVIRIETAMGEDLADRRFIPYIQLHEFEALLLTDPERLARYYPRRQDAVSRLMAELSRFKGPEWVNDGPQTAPSKRILSHIPEYDKPTAGSVIAMDIGLAVIREKCPHFDEWLRRLEALGQGSGN